MIKKVKDKVQLFVLHVLLYYFFNPLPHRPILGSSNSAVYKDMMSKKWTLWEKEKLLAASNFSFSLNVFKVVCS